jgi:plasmid maintenance system antidote protein VapI
MRWQRRWGFRGVHKVIRGDRAISPDTAVRLGKYFGLHRPQFRLNRQSDYELRLAEGSGSGSAIKLRKAAYRGELTGTH